ncbi:protein rep [Clostridium tarantellae]|uniref:Uncharacterized protein n=1 Tax=Clostridium tarantellae TaxID=39493 RepID=A0A6I1MQV7_9CLOT|nr:protein rep [Clostridium tarantellae]MPQ44612.1 hypothetical protein [Clostridium tarantellae]
MDIEKKFIKYYINKNKELKEYIELYEIPRKEDIFLIEKMMSVDISNMFNILGYNKKSYLIENCNSIRYLQQCIDNPNHKYFRGSFCRDRYCPICSHIKSHKTSDMMFKIMKSIQKDNNFKNSSLIMLTLTQKNVGVGELKEEINKMQSAIQAMMNKELIFSTAKNYKKDSKTGKRRSYGTKGVVQGTVRHLEVTSKFNPNNNRIEFHPHWHMIMLVKNSYFTEKFYWSNDKVIRVWKKYMKLDYNPNTDIRKIVDGALDNDKIFNIKLKDMKPEGAIKEICKYSTKDSDIIKVYEDSKTGILNINWSDSTVILKELYLALHNRRDLIFTGAFKKTKERLYGKKDTDDLISEMQDEELIDLFKNKKCKICGANTIESLQRYSAYNKCYYMLEKDKLELYKQKMNDEIKRIIKKKKEKQKLKIKKSDGVLPNPSDNNKLDSSQKNL